MTGLRDEEIEIDQAVRELRVRGQLATPSLSRLELRILAKLLDHRGETVSRAELWRCAWGEAWYDGCYVTLNRAVQRLRHRLMERVPCPPPIVSVRGVGYRLEASPQSESNRP